MKARAKLPAADVSRDIDKRNNQNVDADISLEGQDLSDDSAVMRDEAAP